MQKAWDEETMQNQDDRYTNKHKNKWGGAFLYFSQLSLVIWWIRDTELRIHLGDIFPVKDAYLEIYSKKLGFLGGLCKIFSKGNTEKNLMKLNKKWLSGSKMHLWKAKRKKKKKWHYPSPAERRADWTALTVVKNSKRAQALQGRN